jgi:hypothetical protein
LLDFFGEFYSVDSERARSTAFYITKKCYYVDCRVYRSKLQEDEENHIRRGFVICGLHLIILGRSNAEESNRRSM